MTYLDSVNESVTNGDGNSPHISANALTGVANFRSMRIIGYKNKKPLHILIDSASTHNFLDIQMVTQMAFTIENRAPIQGVVDGSKLTITSMLKGFS